MWHTRREAHALSRVIILYYIIDSIMSDYDDNGAYSGVVVVVLGFLQLSYCNCREEK